MASVQLHHCCICGCFSVSTLTDDSSCRKKTVYAGNPAETAVSGQNIGPAVNEVDVHKESSDMLMERHFKG